MYAVSEVNIRMSNIDDIQIEDLDKEIIERRARRRDKSLKDKRIWMIILAVLVVIAVVIGIIIITSPGNKENGEQSETVGEVIPVETESASEIDTKAANELMVDANPKINNLIETYFDAKLNCDMPTLLKIVSNSEAISEEKLQREKEYIEDYQNIKCYTKNGLLEGTYIVYVYFEYKFYNIDTNAPAMIRMYVCTNEAGDVYIFNEAVEGEIASFMEDVNNGEDVKALFAETDSKLKAAIESDENLMGFYTKLVEGVTPETEASTEVTTEAATEPQTEEITTEASTEAPIEAPTAGGDSVQDTDDTAFVKENAVVYSQPTADEQYKVATVASGERYRRTGYNDKWSRIEYSDGAFGYVSNDKLVIDENFIYVNQTVYAKQTVRVRAEASYDAEVVGTLYEGESVKRLGYNDEWSKVVFEGDIYYIGKGFLTTNQPED